MTSLALKIKAGGATASAAVIDAMGYWEPFLAFGVVEGTAIKTRDSEDGAMLSAGINLSLSSGVLTPSDKSTVPYERVVVDGRTPEDVSEGILKDIVEKSKGKGRENIGVITIVGFSGVGKGTTVAKLKSSLVSLRSDTNPDRVLCWSNGNIFRSLTVLTSLYMQSKNLKNVEEVISGEGSEELKKELMGCLSFEINDSTGEFDTHIVGFGVDYWVKDIETTVLKGPLVSGKIPTVARSTQGEVVKFVCAAVKKLTTVSNFDVIVEGRAETVDYVESDYRYEMVMEDDGVIGVRRAAQRVAGAVGDVEEKGDEEVLEMLKKVVGEIA
ncbi:hypothetical protein TrVE_jg3462 [Triparma verrucosa]|uniref:Uncharacterized protein n=1 Tax=Triparma verrucosa TaxID=1606542 RepID=A0A9W7BG53_9STRA|nr:hypothetical protein TrVE_jg3462 [Triparma verrucosa]